MPVDEDMVWEWFCPIPGCDGGYTMIPNHPYVQAQPIPADEQFEAEIELHERTMHNIPCEHAA